MPLENPTYISDFVDTNPTSADPKSEGDDHIRNMKSAIQTTFPNVTGKLPPLISNLVIQQVSFPVLKVNWI